MTFIIFPRPILPTPNDAGQNMLKFPLRRNKRRAPQFFKEKNHYEEIIFRYGNTYFRPPHDRLRADCRQQGFLIAVRKLTRDRENLLTLQSQVETRTKEKNE